jgi:hypothetical protein
VADARSILAEVCGGFPRSLQDDAGVVCLKIFLGLFNYAFSKALAP